MTANLSPMTGRSVRVAALLCTAAFTAGPAPSPIGWPPGPRFGRTDAAVCLNDPFWAAEHGAIKCNQRSSNRPLPNARLVRPAGQVRRAIAHDAAARPSAPMPACSSCIAVSDWSARIRDAGRRCSSCGCGLWSRGIGRVRLGIDGRWRAASQRLRPLERC
jgi:hypothetical protein